jgi:hypothetical protein
MDTTLHKDSIDILFAIFWVTDQKIWFIKVLDEIWFQILFESCFKSGAATCLLLIGAYRFGRICDVDRRI